MGKPHRFPHAGLLQPRLSRTPSPCCRPPLQTFPRMCAFTCAKRAPRSRALLLCCLLSAQSVEDQRHLRDLVAASDGIAFVADGSVLPRRSGSDDRPMEAAKGAIPFESPESLRREFRLPHRGVVRGMLVPRGVTVIVGGGYHGESREREDAAVWRMSCCCFLPRNSEHAK